MAYCVAPADIPLIKKLGGAGRMAGPGERGLAGIDQEGIISLWILKALH